MRIITIWIALSLPSVSWSFDINALLALATTSKSIEEVVLKLPAEYRENYVLVYDSQSLQKAAPQKPRVIAYGSGRSGLTLAYSSLVAANSNSESIEAIQFDRVRRRFDMFEIRFANGQAPTVARNPPMCLGCHRQDPRPNWAKFDRWPGAYGSQRFGGTTLEGRESKEHDGLRKFAATAAQDPRYRPLLGLEPTGKEYFARMPAERLQEILTTQNNLRVARMAAEVPGYKLFKFAIAGAVLNQGDIESYLPEHFKKGRPKYNDVLVDTYRAIEGFHRYSIRRQLALLDIPITDAQIQSNPSMFANWDLHFRFDLVSKINDGSPGDRHLEKVAKMRWLIEAIIGGEMESWGMALNGRTYTLAQPGWSHQSIFAIPNWASLIVEQDPELMRALTDSSRSLQSRSLEALSARHRQGRVAAWRDVRAFTKATRLDEAHADLSLNSRSVGRASSSR